MKKDTMYSLRLSRDVRDALRKAAQRERRSVASLLDKVIIDYLQEEGYLSSYGTSRDRRLFSRKKVALPAKYISVNREANQENPCIVIDLSLGGVRITYPKGFNIMADSQAELPHFQLVFELPETDEQISLDCTACRVHNVGAETHISAMFDGLSTQNLKVLHSYLM